MTFRCYRQNKSPFAVALGDWFPFRTDFLTSKASPNDRGIIVIVVIIIVIDEADLVFHVGGIIAQRFYLGRPLLRLANSQPTIEDAPIPRARFTSKNERLNSLRYAKPPSS